MVDTFFEKFPRCAKVGGLFFSLDMLIGWTEKHVANTWCITLARLPPTNTNLNRQASERVFVLPDGSRLYSNTSVVAGSKSETRIEFVVVVVVVVVIVKTSMCAVWFTDEL